MDPSEIRLQKTPERLLRTRTKGPWVTTGFHSGDSSARKVEAGSIRTALQAGTAAATSASAQQRLEATP